MKRFHALAWSTLAALSLPAHATLGPFEHGSGIRSQGAGGVGYALGEETTSLAANPAHGTALGNRHDIGVHFFHPTAKAEIVGNALGPDSSHSNDGRQYFYIPQGGMNWKLSDKLSLGFATSAAGLGPDYDNSPYQRFGGAARSHLFFTSATVATALAYQYCPSNALGFGLNFGFQQLSVEGMQFLDNPMLSESPGAVTDNGKDSALAIGFSLGWTGTLMPGLKGGLSYRSRNWTEKHKKYSGLLPEGGRLTLPSIYGGGLAWTGIPNWTLAADYQRYDYHSAGRTFKNSINKFFAEGQRLGSADGPGFGVNNQNAYKFGVAWKQSPTLTWRAGYVTADQMIRPEETFFAIFGTFTVTTHYTAGFTWTWRGWEISGSYYEEPRKGVRGRNSINPAIGGGEADVSFAVRGIGISIGRAPPP